jgi:hypothetical protein
LLVIEVDPRNGGLESMKELQAKLGTLPPGPRVQTGGGGWHGYFRHPPGSVRKTSGMPGIDIKTDGGYIVAPPSVHVSGDKYVWRVKLEAALPDIPESWQQWLALGGCYTEGSEDSKCPESAETPETPGSSRKLQEALARALPQENIVEGNVVVFSEKVASFPENVKEAVRVAIAKTYARGPGQRHEGVKLFVRRLKGIPEAAELSPDDLDDAAKHEGQGLRHNPEGLPLLLGRNQVSLRDWHPGGL